MNMMRARGRHLTALITLCAGVMLTFELFVMVRGAERRQAEFEFKALSRDRIDHFIDRIDDNLHELYDVGSFYDASREVERGGFGVFARRILARHPNILAFAWIPRVTGDWREQLERAVRGQGLTDFRISELDRNGRMVRAGQRELYFPILYVEPFEANRAIWGYDLFSDSVRREAMEKACDTGDQVATARISLIGGGGGDFGCRVFLPIYRKDAPRATIEERRRSLTGFVSVLFRIGEMLDLSMRNLVPRGIDIYLYDKTDPKNVLFLYYSPSPLRKKFAGKGGGEADTSDGFQMVNDFEVAGRTWSIVSRACPEFYSSHRIWWSWFVLAAGLLLTFLLAVAALVALIWILATRAAEL